MDAADIMYCTCRLKPGMEIKNPAKTDIAAAQCGQWTRDKSGLSRAVKKIKKLNKINFRQLRWRASGVATVNDHFLDRGGR